MFYSDGFGSLSRRIFVRDDSDQCCSAASWSLTSRRMQRMRLARACLSSKLIKPNCRGVFNACLDLPANTIITARRRFYAPAVRNQCGCGMKRVLS